MTKQYNTEEYRDSKRVVAFVNPKVKDEILKDAKAKHQSVSKVTGDILAAFYNL